MKTKSSTCLRYYRELNELEKKNFQKLENSYARDWMIISRRRKRNGLIGKVSCLRQGTDEQMNRRTDEWNEGTLKLNRKTSEMMKKEYIDPKYNITERCISFSTGVLNITEKFPQTNAA